MSNTAVYAIERGSLALLLGVTAAAAGARAFDAEGAPLLLRIPSTEK